MKALTKAMASSLLVSTLSAAALVLADPGVKWPSFDQVDQNKDGAIEQSEAKAVKGLNFTTADINHDGKISQDEYKAALLENGQDSGTMGGGSAPQTYTR